LDDGRHWIAIVDTELDETLGCGDGPALNWEQAWEMALEGLAARTHASVRAMSDLLFYQRKEGE
jgi:hypothetical protein